MKKETIEEAAEKFSSSYAGEEIAPVYEGFIEGAKWQQQQMEKLKDFDTWKEWKNTGIIKSE